MKVGSLFAGIGGFDLGFERAGFEVAWCVEWDKAAQKVLRARFPNAQVYGDIREVDPDSLERVDVICGGFPCQDLSVAGKRAGLAGERSGLFHDAMRIVRRLKPAVLVLENVPGLLSSNRGLDFATVLREVGEGWDCAEVGWRVLDSQFFGVAQRRRRVFIVAVRDPGVGCAEEILALASSGGGHPPSRGKARQGSSADAEGRADGGRWWDGSDCAATLTKQNANGAQRMPDKGNLGAVVIDRSAFNQGQNAKWDCPIEQSDAMFSLIARGPHAVGVPFRKSKRAQSAEDDETWVDDGVANTLNGFDTGDARTTHAVAHAFYSTGGTHGLETTPEVSPPLKIGSSLGIPSPPAVAFKTGNSAKARSDGVSEEQSPTLGSNAGGNTVPAVAFSCKDHGGDASTIAPTLRAMPNDRSHANGGGQVAVAMPMVGVCVTGDRTHSLTSNGADASEDGTGRGTPIAIAFPIDTQNMTEGHSSGGLGFGMEHDPSFTLSKSHSHAVATPMVVRRLTPVECERLQGFPDGWTQIGTDKPTADSHRYKQLGNAVTVNVAEWIARRVAKALTDGPKA